MRIRFLSLILMVCVQVLILILLDFLVLGKILFWLSVFCLINDDPKIS